MYVCGCENLPVAAATTQGPGLNCARGATPGVKLYCDADITCGCGNAAAVRLLNTGAGLYPNAAGTTPAATVSRTVVCPCICGCENAPAVTLVNAGAGL